MARALGREEIAREAGGFERGADAIAIPRGPALSGRGVEQEDVSDERILRRPYNGPRGMPSGENSWPF
jgi:hypothetical protein